VFNGAETIAKIFEFYVDPFNDHVLLNCENLMSTGVTNNNLKDVYIALEVMTQISPYFADLEYIREKDLLKKIS